MSLYGPVGTNDLNPRILRVCSTQHGLHFCQFISIIAKEEIRQGLHMLLSSEFRNRERVRERAKGREGEGKGRGEEEWGGQVKNKGRKDRRTRTRKKGRGE